MADFDDEQPKLTLEKIMDGLHREIGETITRMGSEVIEIPDFISRFLQRNESWANFHVEGYRRIAAIGYEDLTEKSKSLYEQAKNIFLEKGYRHSGAVMTFNEHREVGSTVWERYGEMPDTVIPIVKQKLGVVDDEEPMTIEEIRRARILIGRSSIDDTGTITGEIVPITDSYHFLSEERKVEVKELEQQIISGLRSVVYEAVARRVGELTKYKDIIRNLAEGWISRPKAYAQLQELNMPLDVADEAIKLAYQDGRKDDILTPMEIMFLGREVDEQYKANPYTPLGIQRGRLSIEEANKARAEEKYFDSIKDLFTEFQMPFALSLEPLNAEGKTERGPLVLDTRERKPLDSRLVDLYRPNIPRPIPFSRLTDWYHTPVNSAQQ